MDIELNEKADNAILRKNHLLRSKHLKIKQIKKNVHCVIHLQMKLDIAMKNNILFDGCCYVEKKKKGNVRNLKLEVLH